MALNENMAQIPEHLQKAFAEKMQEKLTQEYDRLFGGSFLANNRVVDSQKEINQTIAEVTDKLTGRVPASALRREIIEDCAVKRSDRIRKASPTPSKPIHQRLQADCAWMIGFLDESISQRRTGGMSEEYKNAKEQLHSYLVCPDSIDSLAMRTARGDLKHACALIRAFHPYYRPDWKHDSAAQTVVAHVEEISEFWFEQAHGAADVVVASPDKESAQAYLDRLNPSHANYINEVVTDDGWKVEGDDIVKPFESIDVGRQEPSSITVVCTNDEALVIPDELLPKGVLKEWTGIEWIGEYPMWDGYGDEATFYRVNSPQIEPDDDPEEPKQLDEKTHRNIARAFDANPTRDPMLRHRQL